MQKEFVGRSFEPAAKRNWTGSTSKREGAATLRPAFAVNRTMCRKERLWGPATPISPGGVKPNAARTSRSLIQPRSSRSWPSERWSTRPKFGKSVLKTHVPRLDSSGDRDSRYAGDVEKGLGHPCASS